MTPTPVHEQLLPRLTRSSTDETVEIGGDRRGNRGPRVGAVVEFVEHAAGKHRPALDPRGRRHRSKSGIRAAGVPRLTEALADPRSHLIPRPVDLVRDQVNDPGQLRQRSDRAVVETSSVT
jgi:hypothetical protein